MFCVFLTNLTLDITTKDLHSIGRSRRPTVVSSIECPQPKTMVSQHPPPNNWKSQNRHSRPGVGGHALPPGCPEHKLKSALKCIVWSQCTPVPDRQTDGQTGEHHGNSAQFVLTKASHAKIDAKIHISILSRHYALDYNTGADSAIAIEITSQYLQYFFIWLQNSH